MGEMSRSCRTRVNGASAVAVTTAPAVPCDWRSPKLRPNGSLSGAVAKTDGAVANTDCSRSDDPAPVLTVTVPAEDPDASSRTEGGPLENGAKKGSGGLPKARSVRTTTVPVLAVATA